MVKKIKYNRRNFLSNAVMALGASELALVGRTNSLFSDNNKKQIMNSNFSG